MYLVTDQFKEIVQKNGNDEHFDRVTALVRDYCILFSPELVNMVNSSQEGGGVKLYYNWFDRITEYCLGNVSCERKGAFVFEKLIASSDGMTGFGFRKFIANQRVLWVQRIAMEEEVLFFPGDSFAGCVLFYFSYRMLLDEPLIKKISVRVNDLLRFLKSEKLQCFDKTTLEPALDTATNVVRSIILQYFPIFDKPGDRNHPGLKALLKLMASIVDPEFLYCTESKKLNDFFKLKLLLCDPLCLPLLKRAGCVVELEWVGSVEPFQNADDCLQKYGSSEVVQEDGVEPGVEKGLADMSLNLDSAYCSMTSENESDSSIAVSEGEQVKDTPLVEGDFIEPSDFLTWCLRKGERSPPSCWEYNFKRLNLYLFTQKGSLDKKGRTGCDTILSYMKKMEWVKVYRKKANLVRQVELFIKNCFVCFDGFSLGDNSVSFIKCFLDDCGGLSGELIRFLREKQELDSAAEHLSSKGLTLWLLLRAVYADLKREEYPECFNDAVRTKKVVVENKMLLEKNIGWAEHVAKCEECVPRQIAADITGYTVKIHEQLFFLLKYASTYHDGEDCISDEERDAIEKEKEKEKEKEYLGHKEEREKLKREENERIFAQREEKEKKEREVARLNEEARLVAAKKELEENAEQKQIQFFRRKLEAMRIPDLEVDASAVHDLACEELEGCQNEQEKAMILFIAAEFLYQSSQIEKSAKGQRGVEKTKNKYQKMQVCLESKVRQGKRVMDGDMAWFSSARKKVDDSLDKVDYDPVYSEFTLKKAKEMCVKGCQYIDKDWGEVIDKKKGSTITSNEVKMQLQELRNLQDKAKTFVCRHNDGVVPAYKIKDTAKLAWKEYMKHMPKDEKNKRKERLERKGYSHNEAYGAVYEENAELVTEDDETKKQQKAICYSSVFSDYDAMVLSIGHEVSCSGLKVLEYGNRDNRNCLFKALELALLQHQQCWEQGILFNLFEEVGRLIQNNIERECIGDRQRKLVTDFFVITEYTPRELNQFLKDNFKPDVVHQHRECLEGHQFFEDRFLKFIALSIGVNIVFHRFGEEEQLLRVDTFCVDDVLADFQRITFNYQNREVKQQREIVTVHIASYDIEDGRNFFVLVPKVCSKKASVSDKR